MGRNKNPEETVAKILDAALELFCAQGYEGTSIQDIVDRLDGMTKGAVYHHFKSKEEIFNAAFDRAMTPIVEHRRSMLGVGNMTGAQKLKRLYAPESVVPQIELWARMRPAADPVKSSRLLAMQYQGSFDESAMASLASDRGGHRPTAPLRANARAKRRRPYRCWRIFGCCHCSVRSSPRSECSLAHNVWRRWLPRWGSIWVMKCFRQRRRFGAYGTAPGGNIDTNGM